MRSAAQRPMSSLGLALAIVVAAPAIAVLAAFWPFTADDAYIYMRYGENLVDSGALVFNQGERITTMTSPLLALLDALLYALTGHTRLAYKVLALLLWGLTVWLVVRRCPPDTWLRALVAGTLSLPPAVLLWTIGGMETPVHMLLVTTAMLGALEARRERPGLAAAALVLAGVGTVCRQDAAPFFAGVAVQALRGQPLRRAVLLLGLGALPPLCWSAVSLGYYGDLFPTSFYVKPPSLYAELLAANAIYVGEALLFTGVLPVALGMWWAGRRRPHLAAGAASPPVWLWVGLLLQFAYLTTMATVHMMFAFRAIVPYLPAVLLLAIERARRVDWLPGNARWLAPALVLLIGAQLAQAVRTNDTSIQGLATVGEFRDTPLREFVGVMPVTEQIIAEVRTHWQQLPNRQREHPRILTWAEGLMPHAYREAYFFGLLLSYRHQAMAHPARGDYRAWADYLVVPTAEAHVPGEIAGHPFTFGGRTARIVAIHNPAPLPDVLPATVGAPFPR